MPQEAAPFSSTLLGILVTLGNFAVWLGLVSAILCVGFYWTGMLRGVRRQRAAAADTAEVSTETKGGKKGKKQVAAAAPPDPDAPDNAVRWGRRFFYTTSAFAFLGAICLWVLIFQQEYIVRYIWKNSNSSLAGGFRFASLWGDQEGTFFLWGMYNAVLGGVFL